MRPAYVQPIYCQMYVLIVAETPLQGGAAFHIQRRAHASLMRCQRGGDVGLVGVEFEAQVLAGLALHEQAGDSGHATIRFIFIEKIILRVLIGNTESPDHAAQIDESAVERLFIEGTGRD